MYINTFKYTPKDVSCQLCTEYVKKLGCTALRCRGWPSALRPVWSATHTHSVSIETQQMIIARYLEQYPEISVYDTYIDNGATGTNFAGVR